MKPLRIILVMLEAPLPFGNAASRWTYVLLKGLVERGHRVTAFAAVSNPQDIPQAQALFPAPQYDLRLYPFPQRSGLKAKLETLRRPYSYMFSEELKADLNRERAVGYDILHLEQLWCAWLAIDQTHKTLVNVHFLASIDLKNQRGGWQSWVERGMLYWVERRLLRRLKSISALSQRLVDAVREIAPKADIHQSRLGIDWANYPFREQVPANRQPIIGLIGSMGWYPSHSAAVRLLKDLLPRIRERLPEVNVLIVGWNARTALANYLDSPGVEILENVPETRPYFNQLDLLVYAPQSGSGVKVKVQEAFAYGLPVVTTSEGVEGMPAVDGVHAGICDGDAGLVDRVIERLQHPELAQEQARTARQMLESYCGPDASLNVVEEIYRKMQTRQ